MTPFSLCSYFRAHQTTLFLKILGDGCMGRPPPHILGDRPLCPPRSPPMCTRTLYMHTYTHTRIHTPVLARHYGHNDQTSLLPWRCASSWHTCRKAPAENNYYRRCLPCVHRVRKSKRISCIITCYQGHCILGKVSDKAVVG